MSLQPTLQRPPGPARAAGRVTLIVLAVMVGTLASSLSLPVSLFLISTTAGVVLAVIYRLRRGPVDFFEPVWLFVILLIVAYGWKAALVIANPGDFLVYPGHYDPTSPNAPVLLAGIVGVASALAGYFSGLHPILERCIPNLGDSFVTRRRLVGASGILLLMGVTALLLTAREAGVSVGPGAALFSPQTRMSVLGSLAGTGPVFIFVLVMPLFTLTLLAGLLSGPLRPRHRVAIVSAVIVTTYCMSFFGGRLYLLGFWLALLVMWHYRRRRIRALVQLSIFSGTAVGGAVLGVVLFPGVFSFSAYDLVRRVSGTFDSFEILRIAMADVHSYLWGLSLFEDVTLTYIPRSLINAKPFVYGTVRAQETILPGLFDQFGSTATFPPSILAEGYVNFGIAGVILFPFLAGVLLRALYEKGLRLGGANLAILALTVGQMLTLLRSLGAFLATLVIYSGFAYIVFRARIPLRAHRHTGRL